MFYLGTEVPVSGGTIWWHDLIGPALAAATAIAAAAIAARTANARQGEQLAHDRELQAHQLAYDREQRYRQHVRDTVDAAVANLDSATRAIALYEGTMREGNFLRDQFRKSMRDQALDDQRRSDAEEGVMEARQELSALSEAVFLVIADLASHALRLSLRLGRGHVLTASYYAYIEAYTAQHDIIRQCDREALLGEEDEAKMDEASKATNASGGRFLSSCEEWFEEG